MIQEVTNGEPFSLTCDVNHFGIRQSELVTWWRQERTYRTPLAFSKTILDREMEDEMSVGDRFSLEIKGTKQLKNYSTMDSIYLL